MFLSFKQPCFHYDLQALSLKITRCDKSQAHIKTWWKSFLGWRWFFTLLSDYMSHVVSLVVLCQFFEPTLITAW